MRTCPGTGTGKRALLPAAVRHQINLRDRGKCQICESSKWTEIHHIHPVAKGGGNQPANLMTLCWQHHQMIHLARPIHQSFTSNRGTFKLQPAKALAGHQEVLLDKAGRLR